MPLSSLNKSDDSPGKKRRPVQKNALSALTLTLKCSSSKHPPDNSPARISHPDKMPVEAATSSTSFPVPSITGNDEGSSSDSCDENQNTVECGHINKAVDLQKVRKALMRNGAGFATECEECKKSPAAENEVEMNGDFQLDVSLWMCLR